MKLNNGFTGPTKNKVDNIINDVKKDILVIKDILEIDNDKGWKLYPHAKKYFDYANNKNSTIDNDKKLNKLKFVKKTVRCYKNYIVGLNDNYKVNNSGKVTIHFKKITELLNKYYDTIKGHTNHFTTRQEFRSTILEELMVHLFKKYLKTFKGLKYGKAECYTNLHFLSNNTQNFLKETNVGINKKNQDFAIYKEVKVTIDSVEYTINIPLVAIENKTFIDKNMFESANATADKIKQGNPYSLYIVVTEEYAIDTGMDPVFSSINQIFVLRKGNRYENNIIDTKVLNILFAQVKEHIDKESIDIKQRIKQGIIFT